MQGLYTSVAASFHETLFYFQNILNQKDWFAKTWVYLFFNENGSQISFGFTAVLLYLLLSVLIYFFKDKTGQENHKKLKTSIKVLTEPLETILKWSSGVIQKPLKNILNPSHGVSLELIKENYQSVVGAGFLVVIFYLVTILLLALADGISIEAFNMIFVGTLDDKFHLLIKFVKENIFFNFTVILLYAFSLYYKTTTNIMEPEYQNASMSGLIAAMPISKWDTFPNLKATDKELMKTYQEELARVLNDKRIGRIQIKVASGYECFGPSSAPGFLIPNLISNSNVNWEILLLDPDSNGAELRGNSYLSASVADKPVTDLASYKRGIKEVINHLLEMKLKYHLHLEIKLYSHNPVWKFFLVPTVAVVQAFGRGDRSDYTPAYFLEKNDTSLYHGFQFTFNEVWQESKLVTEPFDL